MTDQDIRDLTPDLEQVLVLARGLPGAGKSDRSRKWVKEAPGRRARVNRDADRVETFCHDDVTPLRSIEVLVSGLQRNTVAYLLDHGLSVVLDNTHMNDQIVDYWRKFATAREIGFKVWDMRPGAGPDGVPLETCIERDLNRAALGGRYVTEAVIRDMYERSTASWQA